MSTSTISSREMRDALSNFATGVTIVTTTEHGGTERSSPIGMTASSFNSVSMDPPLILWSVTKAALSAEVFRSASHFCVHVLSADQVELSNQFARSGTDKFAGVDYSLNENNIPLLPGVASRFECKTWNTYEGGDHWIIVGEVTRLEKANTEGLVFSGGSYATASPVRLDLPASGHAGAETQRDDSPIDSMLIYNLSRAYRQVSYHFHQSVRASGLSVPEWRILASLHSRAQRSLPDLASRTFIDSFSLVDMLIPMRDAGLCELSGEPAVDNKSLVIAGTTSGHNRVEHLFALGKQQEQVALQDAQADNASSSQQKNQAEDFQSLISLLQRVIHNTN